HDPGASDGRPGVQFLSRQFHDSGRVWELRRESRGRFLRSSAAGSALRERLKTMVLDVCIAGRGSLAWRGRVRPCGCCMWARAFPRPVTSCFRAAYLARHFAVCISSMSVFWLRAGRRPGASHGAVKAMLACATSGRLGPVRSQPSVGEEPASTLDATAVNTAHPHTPDPSSLTLAVIAKARRAPGAFTYAARARDKHVA
ncbi:hypothetical protein PSPO01_10570, partial [Paraphaeosphaeria sporulosa]